MPGRVPILPILAAGLLTGPAMSQAPTDLPAVDYLRVEKAARRLELWQGVPGEGGHRVRVIEGIQLGDAPVGPKRFEGDERTPEGRYVIDWGNPRSAYNLSLHISYPNAEDRAYARAQGRSAGGMIMIHGQPNDRAGGRVPGDWTDGCIAVSNAEIEFLWQVVGDGTPIEIVP
ncbi:L,D-transpeptidase family protein [Novosphingobium profundi]|uniref:L,D-transpeptidase family protein n=1 Tax=Novosphingobium profundi TaxID=1774954 RepID=UPI001BD9D074|nr:L,D-transpeptidase family protein [Novosphingobium profundi]